MPGEPHYSSSLDAPILTADANEPQTLADTLGDDDDGLGLVEARLSLEAAMTLLPYTERRALSLLIESNMRQADIAQHMGCSQMQVSRLLRRASVKLRALIDPDLPSERRATVTDNAVS